MSRQAVVGAFTLLGIVALFVVYFVLSNLSARVSGYQIGVHFNNASGLTRGALVYESGLQVGSVSEIRMLNDFTVDVVMQIVSWADIPRDSEFLIAAPLTGTSTVTIVPPKRPRSETAMLPRYVLPVDQQPHGTTPVSVQDLLETGRTQLNQLGKLMNDISAREPRLISELESAIKNANELAMNANGLMRDFSARGTQLTASLQHSVDSAGANIVDLTGQLDQAMRRNGGRVDTLLASLNRTASSLQSASAQLQTLASDPQLRGDVMNTTHEISQAMTNIAALSGDLRKAAEDPVAQGQLADTLAHIDAASQRASSLLGALGGTSSVYGVDAGATPPPTAAPGAGGQRIVPPAAAPAVPSPAPLEKKKTGAVQLSPGLRNRIGDVAKSLIEVQISLSELSAKTAGAANTPLLNTNRGPVSDFNVVVLPHADQQLYVGVNDLSANQTWNFAMRERIAPNAYVGGGVLYSRLGVMGLVTKGVFGVEGLAYDPRNAYVDAYLKLHALPNLELFAGERDILHNSRRTTYGLQYRFLGGL